MVRVCSQLPPYVFWAGSGCVGHTPVLRLQMHPPLSCISVPSHGLLTRSILPDVNSLLCSESQNKSQISWLSLYCTKKHIWSSVGWVLMSFFPHRVLLITFQYYGSSQHSKQAVSGSVLSWCLCNQSVCVVFSNRVLASSFSEPPREMTITCDLWGTSGNSVQYHLRGYHIGYWILA